MSPKGVSRSLAVTTTTSGFGTQEGAKSKRGGSSEIVRGMQEGSQTSRTGVERSPGPTTTLPKPGGRPGGVLSRGHGAAGKPAQENTEVASPVPGPTQGQEGSGGAPGRPETIGPTPHSPESLTRGLESEFRPERTVTRSPAGKAPGQSSAGVSRPPLPSEEISGTMTRSSVERKVTT